MNNELIETMRDPAERLARRIRDILGPYNDDEESLQVLVSSLVLKLDDMQAAASAHDTEEFIAIHRTYNAQAADSDLRAWMAGHARVPVEPTEAMLDAAINACAGKMYPQDLTHGQRAMMRDRFKAMLAATKDALECTGCGWRGTKTEYRAQMKAGGFLACCPACELSYCREDGQQQALPQGVEEWIASGKDYDRNIHSNPDAKAWAEFFMETFPNCGANPATMHSWFANAMMAMHDHLLSGMAIVPVDGFVIQKGSDEYNEIVVTGPDLGMQTFWPDDAAYGLMKAMLAATKEKGE